MIQLINILLFVLLNGFILNQKMKTLISDMDWIKNVHNFLKVTFWNTNLFDRNTKTNSECISYLSHVYIRIRSSEYIKLLVVLRQLWKNICCLQHIYASIFLLVTRWGSRKQLEKPKLYLQPWLPSAGYHTIRNKAPTKIFLLFGSMRTSCCEPGKKAGCQATGHVGNSVSRLLSDQISERIHIDKDTYLKFATAMVLDLNCRIILTCIIYINVDKLIKMHGLDFSCGCLN